MPSLLNLLSRQESTFLRTLAEFWGLSHANKDRDNFAALLAEHMTKPEVFSEMFEILPDKALQALQKLKAQDGHLLWALFAYQYGEPFFPSINSSPAQIPTGSTTDWLWQRALIGRAFIRLDNTLREVAYIPDEFLALIPAPAAETKTALAEHHSDEVQVSRAFSDAILDDLCTYLASLRHPGGLDKVFVRTKGHLGWTFIAALAASCAFLTRQGAPAERARAWLEASRTEAYVLLTRAWQRSEALDELTFVPRLHCDANGQIPAHQARQCLLQQIALQGPGWISLNELQEHFREHFPFFLRSPEDINARLIVEESNQAPLTGIANWLRVEGRYLRFMICEVLPLLGLLELGQKPGDKAIFFRKTAWFKVLNADESCPALSDEQAKVQIHSNGLLRMSCFAPRMARYMLSRFALWLNEEHEQYRFQLEPGSLQNAGKQGLTVPHLISLLHKYGQRSPSPGLQNALRRWEQNGCEAQMSRGTVLQLASPETLQALRASSAASSLGEALGPTAVFIKPGREATVQQALARLEILCETSPKASTKDRHAG